jgi:hypothetical protein
MRPVGLITGALAGVLLAACAQEPRSVPGAVPSALTPPGAAATPPGPAPTTVANGGAPPPAAGGASTPAPVTAAAAPDASVITFAPPVLLHIGDRYLPAVLATNTSNQVVGFTVEVTWKRGGAVAGTSRGSAQNVLPYEQRAVNLAFDTPIPPDATGQAQVERMLPPPPASTVQALASIGFGRTSIVAGGIPDLQTFVTNGDAAPHSLTVGAALVSKGTLVATASGALGSIAPRLTLPVLMPIAGDDSAFDQILIYVETVTG